MYLKVIYMAWLIIKEFIKWSVRQTGVLKRLLFLIRGAWELAIGGNKFLMHWRENMELSPISCTYNLPKLVFKKSICKALFAALEGEEDYIETPNLLSKITLYIT